jgi:GNAT superfamily N-acetyltransferase
MKEAGFEKGGDAQTVHWLVSHPEIELFVAADRADRVVGLVSMSHRPQLRQSGRIATIEELVVTHEWRRRGVGRALLKHAVERAQVLSVKSLQVQAPLDNPLEMAAFCRACGFVPDPVGVYLWAPGRA